MKKQQNNLPQIFTYEESHKVRVVLFDNETWFIASDICKILDMKDTRRAVSRLDDDEKKKLLGLKSQVEIKTNNNVWTINESGLYNLIFRSNKPEAKQFRRWVTHEVLPALRKTGTYTVQQPQHKEIPVEEYTMVKEAIEMGAIVCGSRNKLAKRIGVSAGTLTQVSKKPWLFAQEFTARMILACHRIINRKGAMDMDILDMLMSIGDSKVRTGLFDKIKKGGLL